MLIEVVSNRWENHPPGQGRITFTYFGLPWPNEPFKSWPGMTFDIQLTSYMRNTSWRRHTRRMLQARHTFRPWRSFEQRRQDERL